jgi:hypothetical protein
LRKKTNTIESKPDPLFRETTPDKEQHRKQKRVEKLSTQTINNNQLTDKTQLHKQLGQPSKKTKGQA